MGLTVEGYGTGGRGYPDAGDFIQCTGKVGPIFWVIDVVDVTTLWEDFGRLSPSRDTPTDGVAAKKTGVWELGITTFGRGNFRCGIIRGGEICHLWPEHSHTVYCNQTHYVSMSSGTVATWGVGVPATVGAGELGPRGYEGGEKGGGYGGYGG